MGRKPKIIPHIPGTLEQIADALFAKDKAKKEAVKEAEKNQKPRRRKLSWD